MLTSVSDSRLMLNGQGLSVWGFKISLKCNDLKGLIAGQVSQMGWGPISWKKKWVALKFHLGAMSFFRLAVGCPLSFFPNSTESTPLAKGRGGARCTEWTQTGWRDAVKVFSSRCLYMLLQSMCFFLLIYLSWSIGSNSREELEGDGN